MALSRRTGARFQTAIWPGFVDAMTGLLLVLTFVLAIFIVVQFVLQETISGQESELDELTLEIASLADALGIERARTSALQENVNSLSATLGETEAEVRVQTALIASLTAERDAQAATLDEA
ncbi:MAG: peptidoglycan-binding protein, partial [Pseudomonadota bacterium]